MNIRKHIIIGFLVSLFATFCGMFLYTQYISEYTFVETLKMISADKVLGSVIAISAIPNLLVFFVFLKKNQEYKARGVLIGVIVTAFVTFLLKFL